MTATVIHLPLPRAVSPTDALINAATHGALATSDGRLYCKGGPGWICVAGSPHGPTYMTWEPQLGPNAVLIREGL